MGNDCFLITGKERRGCQLSPSFMVDGGSELERMQAAQKIAHTRYLPTIFHDFNRGITNDTCDKLKLEHACKVVEWIPRPQRVLTVRLSHEASRLKVTCCGISGSEEYPFGSEPQTKLAELRARIVSQVGLVFLASADGRFLAETEDQGSLASLL